jgi:anti-sigma-K factor RskA
VSPPNDPAHRPSPPAGGHPLDDLAAYALDALDDAERRAVDHHLAGCAVCRAELAGHHEALAALASDEAPPASLWQRIATDIGAPDLADPTRRSRAATPAAPEDRSVVPFRAPAGRQPGRSRWMTAAAAALAVAAAVVAVFGFAGRGSDGADTVGELAQQAEEHGETLGTLETPDGRSAAEVVADGGSSYVVLDGLQALPEGRAYQLWSTDGPQPVSLGLLGDGKTGAVAVSLPPTATSLAISEEVDTGAPAPTTIVATGQITRS